MLKTKLFIKGCSAITPQARVPDLQSLSWTNTELKYFSCLEPDYKLYIEPMTSRRMSRLMKMGLVSAKMCLNDANISSPEAIITGTGLGCSEDTEKFLVNLIVNEEKMLKPTPFIQSTHNTIGSQIAINLNCHGYNITFAHRGHSFESAIIDAILFSRDNNGADILVGGFDEITQTSYHILQRLGVFRNTSIKAGEGAAFFVFNTLPSMNNYACLQAIDLITKPSKGTINQQILSFIKKQSIDIKDIDLVLCGSPEDIFSEPELKSLLEPTKTKFYKHLCGEYHTASAFALNLAANIIKQESSIKNVLIWNNYLQINHSFFYLSAC